MPECLERIRAQRLRRLLDVLLVHPEARPNAQNDEGQRHDDVADQKPGKTIEQAILTKCQQQTDADDE